MPINAEGTSAVFAGHGIAVDLPMVDDYDEFPDTAPDVVEALSFRSHEIHGCGFIIIEHSELADRAERALARALDPQRLGRGLEVLSGGEVEVAGSDGRALFGEWSVDASHYWALIVPLPDDKVASVVLVGPPDTDVALETRVLEVLQSIRVIDAHLPSSS